jgi:hypothetical protein
MTTPHVSKDIMTLLISQYFDKESVYNCQFTSKWVKKCISEENLYLARCAKIAKNMQEKQNKYIFKRRLKDIKECVNQEISLLRDGGDHLYLTKKLIDKYNKQEGDTRCWSCGKFGTPNVIREHKKVCTWKPFSDKCKHCGCENPEEYKSPHWRSCPLIIIPCEEFNNYDSCNFKGIPTLFYLHIKSCRRKCQLCLENIPLLETYPHLYKCKAVRIYESVL